MLDGFENVLVIKGYYGDAVTDRSESELKSLWTYIERLLASFAHNPMQTIPDYLSQHQFQSTSPYTNEENLEAEFGQKFERVCTLGESMKLDASYDSDQRRIAHRVADQLGLQHESSGNGEGRQLFIWRSDSRNPLL